MQYRNTVMGFMVGARTVRIHKFIKTEQKRSYNKYYQQNAIQATMVVVVAATVYMKDG